MRRIVHASRVVLELQAVLELLFLRDRGKSIRRLRKLLGTHKIYEFRTFEDSWEKWKHGAAAQIRIAHLIELEDVGEVGNDVSATAFVIFRIRFR